VKLESLYMNKSLAYILFEATTIFVQDGRVKNNGGATCIFQQDFEGFREHWGEA